MLSSGWSSFAMSPVRSSVSEQFLVLHDMYGRHAWNIPLSVIDESVLKASLLLVSCPFSGFIVQEAFFWYTDLPEIEKLRNNSSVLLGCCPD